MAGLTVLDPVDKVDGWDLALKKDVAKLKDLITRWRPLHTHFAPNCRIFSVAFHPLSPDHEVEQDPTCQYDMVLACSVCKLAEHVYALKLFSVLKHNLGLLCINCLAT